MAAYRPVYDSRHLHADCQELGSAPEPYTLDNRVWATFLLLREREQDGIDGKEGEGPAPNILA